MIVVFCLIGIVGSWAQNVSIQPKINSPFSRIGLGDPFRQTLQASSGMGHLSAAFTDAYNINLQNPASLASLKSTSFEVGLYARYSDLESDGQSENMWSSNLKSLVLGFPLINQINKALDRNDSPLGLGMSVSLVPYTLVGYNVESVQDDPNFGGATNFLKGTGGTYSFRWGNGVKYKGFSAGVNLGYLFGKITNSRRIEFDSVATSYNSEFLDEVSVGGLIWSFGLQYTHSFKKLDDNGEQVPTGDRLTIGVYGSPNNGFNTNSSSFYYRDNFEYFELDTIFSADDVEGNGTLPSELGVGFLYEKANKVRVGAEYRLGQWSNYENDGKQETLEDTWGVSLGGEYIPNISSYKGYFQKVRYRFGLFYDTDPRLIDGEQVTNYGLTFGLGFPIIMPRQRISFLNLAIEAGQLGLPDSVTETYVQFSLGFTLNDNSWFFKRKFN